MMTDLFQQSAALPFADVHFHHDPDTQLRAIIAIHSTVLGPAMGGCRFVHYSHTQDALLDALHLSRAMTYKAAINRLPFGGGKAVILAPEKLRDRLALMKAFGDFVDSLGGRYITAVDSGTASTDMDWIASRTTHVFCTTQQSAGSGDPSPFTALGVLRGIEAAVKYTFNRDKLAGLHALIQGVGHVGYELARLLTMEGVKITVTDINPAAVKRCQDEFSAAVVKVGEEYAVNCDIFCPCALGQSLNSNNINTLRAKIVAGAANNQLDTEVCGERLRQQGILYVPDYVVNSGGILQIAYSQDAAQMERKINQLYDTLLSIFAQSEQQQIATNGIADQMAEAILNDHQSEQKMSMAN
ncbi:MAG: amino acid dehydrogenase [Gammaproteobacteria bacterium]|nr:amino acid dehydrogenase [Gammaproteobacteria bacterium]